MNAKKEIPFWMENPNILLKPEYVTEFFPSGDMEYMQKLNAISRLLILVTIVMFVYTQNVRAITFGFLSLACVYLVYYYHYTEKKKFELAKMRTEAMNNMMDTAAEPVIGQPPSAPAQTAINRARGSLNTAVVFDRPTVNNPFSNVLITDYVDNPNKKPAPAAFNQNENQYILEQAKQAVARANPNQPDIADKIFRDLGEQFNFEQSMRPFISNPSTTIPNDQQAFSDFCYGSMISCKEGNQFACARNNGMRYQT